ncbi:sugar phosphate nucleotidyltransferase, partial [Pelagibacteraceae bacterium]|nr:sugar phosphate nucleotidyltransferase [Pelagibacteraceae bacterium]
MNNKYTFIIAAAGLGTRLQPLTNNKPKSLLEIDSKSILSWQLTMIPKKYINEVIIIIGHEGQQIKNEILNLNLGIKVKFIFNELYKECSCGLSFALTKNMIDGPIIYINSDLIIKEGDLLKFLDNQYENSLLVNLNEIQHSDFIRGEIKNNHEMIYWPEVGYGDKGNCIIVGPFKMTNLTHNFICKEYDKLGEKLKKKISCYGLFSKAIAYQKFYGINILCENFWEIDTYEDLTNANITLKSN